MEYHSRLKRNEKTWRKFKCILLSQRSPSEKDHNYLTFWKRQTCGERWVVAKGWGKEGWMGEVGELLGPWKRFCMTLKRWIHVTGHLSKPMENTHHWVGTLTWTVDCGRRQCNNVGSFIIHCGGCWWGRLSLCGSRGHVGNLCTFLSLLLWTWNCSLKITVTKTKQSNNHLALI